MRLPKLIDRTSGVLLHPTSLPGGDLGATAREMVDFLAAAGQSWWQMLPVGPTGYGNSPYSAQSAFAGNPALIDAARLRDDGLLAASDRRGAREEQLAEAFSAFSGSGGKSDPDFQRFTEEAREWLDDFALYRAIKKVQGEVQWTRWPAPLRDRDAAALARFSDEMRRELDFVRFVQWRFFRDWQALREYAHARGIGLIGDLPIFLAHDSADVWLNRHQFYLDDARRADAGGRRAARLLQRHRPALGESALPLGGDARHRVRLVDRPLPRDVRRCSTPFASITSSATRATGRSRRGSRPR